MSPFSSGLRAAFLLVAVSGGIAACAGGTSSPSSPIVATPTRAQSAMVEATAGAGGFAGSIALPSVAGFATTVQFGSNTAPAGASLAIAESRTLPPSLVPLSNARRVTAPARQRYRAPPADANALLYFTLTPSVSFPLSGAPGFTIDAPSTVGPPGTLVLLAYDDPKHGWIELGGFTVSGTVLTFAGTPKGTFPILFVAGTTYGIAVYTTTSAPPQPMAVPSALVFLNNGNSQILTVSEQGYQGTFVATTSDPTIATVAPQSGHPDIFGVTALGLGNATIYITDSYGVTLAVPVAVDNLIGVTDTPTPEPATPTPTPERVKVAPNAIDLYYPASQQTPYPLSTTVYVSETGYRGSFTPVDVAASPCTPYADTVAVGSAITPAAFMVTATHLGPGGAGVKCAIDFTDADGRSASLTVTIHPPLTGRIH